MAEADRLDALCRLRGVPELARTLWPDGEVKATAEFQRRLAEELVREVSEFLPLLGGSGARLLEWMLVRLHVKAPTAQVSWEEFAISLPAGPLRESVEEASENPARPFFMEAALDRGYYRELLARAAGLPEDIERLVRHEAETFQRSLLARGRANYGLATEVLAQFQVLDKIPAKPTERYRLANRAMRRSPTGLGTVMGYVILRRIEIANLTTISEGIRLGLSDEIIRRSVIHV